MNNFFLNISKNIKFYFILISFLMSCYLIWLVFSDFNKGFNLVDESYYLNLYANPLSENFPFSYFHYIGSVIFIIAQKNVITLRYIGYIILFLSVILSCYSIIKSRLILKKGSLINFLLVTISIISINNYYGIYLSTPSYNLFNISLILIVISLSFLRFNSLKSDNLLLNVTLALSVFLLTINKFSSSFIILIFLFLLFHKNISKKFVFHFVISNLLISLIFLYFEYEKISLVIDYLFFENQHEIVKNHNLKLQILEGFKDLYLRLINYNLKYYYIIFLILSILLKSNLNIFIIFFIFFEFLIYNNNGGGLSISTVYLFLYNLSLFIILKNKIYIKNSIYLFVAYFLCLTFWFGSNNEINRYINISSLFLYICYYLLIVNNLGNNYKKKNEIVCFVFFILVFINLYKITHHHKKIDYSFRDHINKNNVDLKAIYNKKSLKGIKVRKEFQIFLEDYTKILSNNKWNEGDYIIDATLKNPGFIFLADAKYLFKGWYGHNPDVLKIALESMDKNIKPWIILSKNSDIQKIVMSNFYPFDENYNLIGTIKDPVSSRQYKLYKPNLNDNVKNK